MARSREWHNPEIHLPLHVMGLYETQSGAHFLTNARPERVTSAKKQRLGEVMIRRELAQFTVGGEPTGQWVLQGCGFVFTASPNKKPREGKFVFHKDGTFFLAATHIPHIDLPESINVYDSVAILSAGFITLTVDAVDLHGESVGLRKGPYFGTPFDRQAISTHFSIPFSLTDDEFID